MELILTVRGLIKQEDWLLKLDLKDAYLTVLVHQDYQKYIRFQLLGRSFPLA